MDVDYLQLKVMKLVLTWNHLSDLTAWLTVGHVYLYFLGSVRLS